MTGARSRLRTEAGDVEVWLEPSQEGLRRLRYEGTEEAVEYVRFLVRNAYGDRGRLLGEACTPEELAGALHTAPLKDLLVP